MPDALLWTYAALAGAAVGSFLNVCIYRLPAGESIISPRSRCPACAYAIPWYDNVPVLSYVLLRGSCRACRAPISLQYPLVELATALLWLAAAARYGPSLEGLRSAVFFTLLLGIALIDGRHFIIPDHLSLGGLGLGLGFAALPGGFPLLRGVVGAAAGYVLLRGVAYGGQRLFRKPALGLGDVHMMAMVGAFLGVPGMLLTILLGSALGLVIGVPLSWRRGRLTLMGTYLPLGTFLAMGAAIAHGWGDLLVDWYLHAVMGVP
ncbi:MAG: prepilin peptidase [Gemmatimonadetes bacterium]|nr:prepilin peptidase [Gemmatimonadota bacterium]